MSTDPAVLAAEVAAADADYDAKPGRPLSLEAAAEMRRLLPGPRAREDAA